MSVLTKVFVILVTIFSVMLVAVVVTFVVNQENLRTALVDAEADALMARSAAKALQGEQEAHQNQVAIQLDRLQQQANSLQASLVSKDEQAATAEANEVSLNREITQLKAINNQMAASQRIVSEMAEAQRTELKALRFEINRVGAELILITDRLAAKTTENEALIRDLRAKKEVLEATVSDYNKLWALAKERGWSPGDEDPTEGITRAETRIDGMVTAVESTEGGEIYVQVNVGRNDGVLDNMEFVVFNRDKRGVQYKGTMLVQSVDAAESSGKLRLVQQGQKIVKGDQILSGPSSGR